MTDVRTERYQFSHGHAPRGRGLWIFRFDGCDMTDQTFRGTYTEAKRQAVAYAHAMRYTRVEVQP